MTKKLLTIVSISLSLHAQDLRTSIEEVLSTNPIIQERLKNYNATKEDVTSAKAGYYPKLDLTLGAGYESVNRTDRAPSLPDQDTSLNVYQNSLKYTQNIFKGFETTHQVQQREFQTLSAAYSYIEKVNDTSFEMVNTYIQVMKNQELLQTAQENVDINRDIFVKVQKLYNAGLTTLSEVNKIESTLALAESNLVVQENTILDVSYNLQRVLGRYIDAKEMSKPSLNITLPATVEEAAQYAMQNNPSLLVSDYNIKLAQATHRERNAPFYPHLDIEVSQSMNKNLSGTEGNEDSFRAMAFVTYNLFNGFSDTAALQKSISQVFQEVQTKNTLRRKVIEGLNLSWAANEKLTQQLIHLKNYKKFSLKTLTLYSKEYDLGRRSLLDLLSAQNDFIRSKAQIITTEYSILFAKYRILDAMGALVRTVLGNQEMVYSNVGLVGETPQNSDTLPVDLDRDKDLITDDRDICNNSLSTTMKNIYGCSFESSSLSTIERYDAFLFEDEKITQSSNIRLTNLLKQLKPYGLQNIKITILSNAFDDTMEKDKLEKLSAKRAEVIQAKLLEVGMAKESITVLSNSNTAPILLDDIKRNNRVDLIVKKIKK
jgi:adhesin transport system outer membrane protein